MNRQLWPLARTLLELLFKGLAVLLAFATPLLGVWCASSLAAYSNGPIWLALLTGALLFPVLPVAWELWAERRARRKGSDSQKKRILTAGDRLVLRTLALNGGFLFVLLAAYPRIAFAALSTRGDWMVEGNPSARAAGLRRVLFATANGLEWLYLATHDNPFRKLVKSDDAPTPAPSANATSADNAGEKAPSPGGTSAPAIGSTTNGGATARPEPAHPSWPFEGKLEASVTGMPAEAEQSIASVAQYIAEREPDPVMLVKALHDYVADRVSYDVASYRAGVYPPQDAETVFRTRKSVCAGYAELLSALGKAAGAEIAIVVGYARTISGDLSGVGHAWNAARIQGRWYLLDATWDSGTVDEATFTKRYTTDYLLTSPEVFGADHFPDDPNWQLLEAPLSRGDFLRQPAIRPSFFAKGLRLIRPTRSQVTVNGSLDVELANPRGVWLSGVFGKTSRERCRFVRGEVSHLECAFPFDGEYALKLFTNDAEFGTYRYAGMLEVINAP